MFKKLFIHCPSFSKFIINSFLTFSINCSILTYNALKFFNKKKWKNKVALLKTAYFFFKMSYVIFYNEIFLN